MKKNRISMEMQRDNIMTAHDMGLLDSAVALKLYNDITDKIDNILVNDKPGAPSKKYYTVSTKRNKQI